MPHITKSLHHICSVERHIDVAHKTDEECRHIVMKDHHFHSERDLLHYLNLFAIGKTAMSGYYNFITRIHATDNLIRGANVLSKLNFIV